MRKINFLLAGLATLFMASCSNDEPANNGGGTAESKDSYLSIKITSPVAASRAADGYLDGSTAENKINKVYFYFFKGGKAFTLYDTTNNPAGNMVEKAVSQSGDNDDTNDIESIANPIVVIKHLKGDLPDQMVVVINKNLGNLVESVSALKGIKADYLTSATSEGTFVMSNSMIEGGEITPINPGNLADSEAEAQANPITIYVERVVARVDVSGLQAGANSGYWQLANESTTDGKQLYAKLEGFDFHNVASNSYIVKNVDFSSDPWPNWSSTYRSFWANTEGITIADQVKWSTATSSTGNAYIQENTTSSPTTLVFGATLGTLDGTTFTPVEIAYWKGAKLAGAGAVKTAMAAYLGDQNKTLWIKNGEGWAPITADHLDFVAGTPTDEDSYKVTPVIGKDAAGNDIVVYAKSGDTDPLSTAAANKHLSDNLDPALIYKDGKTYYYTEIEHNIANPNRSGVVRNHIYDIRIQSVSGLGTPVYDPDHVIIPSKPEFKESYIAARLRILSWRVVTQNVNLNTK